MADSNVRTLDPKKVIVTFGQLALSGWMDGTYLTVTPSGPGFEKLKGADGGVDRVNKNSNDYTITFVLKQTSPINAQLSTIYNSDKLNNLGKFPLTIKDNSGTTKFFAQQAWISADPTAENSDVISPREWTIETGIATNNIGGNLA